MYMQFQIPTHLSPLVFTPVGQESLHHRGMGRVCARGRHIDTRLLRGPIETLTPVILLIPPLLSVRAGWVSRHRIGRKVNLIRGYRIERDASTRVRDKLSTPQTVPGLLYSRVRGRRHPCDVTHDVQVSNGCTPVHCNLRTTGCH